MPSSPFSENCKPPKPPILASLSGGLSVNYTEGNNVSDRVPRFDLVIDISWRVVLQKALCPFRLNLYLLFS